MYKKQVSGAETIIHANTLTWAATDFLPRRRVTFDIDCLSLRRNTRCTALVTGLNRFFADNPVYLSKYFCKGFFHVGCFQSRRLHEVERLFLSQCFAIISWDGHKMSEIRFVADEHYYNVGVSVFPQLLQPPLNILECGMPSDVVNKERTNSSSIVSTCNRTISIGTIKMRKRTKRQLHCKYQKNDIDS